MGEGRHNVHARARRSAPGAHIFGAMRARGAVATVAVALALVTLPAAGEARMKSTKLGDGTCATVGGGRIVDIPGFPGERIDRRLLADIRWLRRRYPLLITDGYSTDAVHAANGEHPLGLALDIVPDKAAGGTWAEISALARWAEPRQNQPRAPFRWVGYNGDAGHGRGDHLHLSWNHSPTRPGGKARTVYTLRCPNQAAPLPPADAGGDTPPPPPPPTGGTDGKSHYEPETGGVSSR
jgi:hypothetical protein